MKRYSVQYRINMFYFVFINKRKNRASYDWKIDC